MFPRRRFLVLALAFGLCFGLVANEAVAQATVKTCYCVTPWKKGGKTTGKQPGGRRPSSMMIKWGTKMANHTAVAGETPTQVAQDLANQLAAAGAPVGPVATDPVTGRAVFCIDGKPPKGGTTTKENDTGIKEVTHRTINSASSWFLRNVAGAFTVASLPAAGGSFTVEVIATTADGAEAIVDATVTTFPGQTGDSVTANLIAQLNELGFDATLIEHDFGEGPAAAIDIAPGIYAGILGLAEITQDANLNNLRIASWDELAADAIDLDGDGVATVEDAAIFLDRLRADDPRCDLNADGRMDVRDLRIYVENLSDWRPRPGVTRPRR